MVVDGKVTVWFFLVERMMNMYNWDANVGSGERPGERRGETSGDTGDNGQNCFMLSPFWSVLDPCWIVSV